MSPTRAGSGLPGWLQEALAVERVADRRPPASCWLFEGKKPGTHLLDIENAHKAVLDATDSAFVLYDLRHTFAARFYQAIKDVVALKEALGHSNLRTIMKYVHVGRERVNGAMKVYEASLRQGQRQKRATGANQR